MTANQFWMDKKQYMKILDEQFNEGFDYEEYPNGDIVLFYQNTKLGSFNLTKFDNHYTTGLKQINDIVIRSIFRIQETHPFSYNQTIALFVVSERRIVKLKAEIEAKKSRLARVKLKENISKVMVKSADLIKEDLEILYSKLNDEETKLNKLNGTLEVIAMEKIKNWK